MCTGLARTGQHLTARDGLHGQEAQVTAHSPDWSAPDGRGLQVLTPSSSVAADARMAARSGLQDPSWHQPVPTGTGSGGALRTVWTILRMEPCSADGVDNVDASADLAKVRVAGSNPVVRSR
jgi:hypothetical protein